MALITCPECGKEVSDKAEYCPNCGSPINNAKDKMYCQHCGELIDKDCVICPKCGKQVGKIENSEKSIIINNNNNNNNSASSVVSANVGTLISPKSRLVTLLLCLFLGAFGVHRFYVGKIGTGIIMILLMITGIGEIWLIVDLFLILFGVFKDKNGLNISKW